MAQRLTGRHVLPPRRAAVRREPGEEELRPGAREGRTREFPLYDLCRIFASLLLAAGAPITFVASQLGHSKPTTTLQFYAHWLPMEHRGGLPTLTTDDRYLVGPLPGVTGTWVMSGCCVGGLSVSPALAEAIAEWILDGSPALDVSETSPARFVGRDVDETELRESCRRAYATHYRASGERDER